MSKLSHYNELRSKRISILTAAEMSAIDWKGGLLWSLKIIAALVVAGAIEQAFEAHAEERAEPHRVLATENLAALNLCMAGRPFVDEDGNILLTERAKEVRWVK